MSTKIIGPEIMSEISSEIDRASGSGKGIDRMTAFNQDVGQWLQEARLGAGLTLRQAATAINASVRQIKSIEAGKMNVVGSDFHAFISAYRIPTTMANSFLEDYGLNI